jgi:hypothetical protein
MYRSKILYRFHFDDHLVLDDQIGPEPRLDADVLVNHRDRLLPDHAKVLAAQFIRQHGIVDRFEQARPESRMEAESGIHDLPRNRILRYGEFLLFSRLGGFA